MNIPEFINSGLPNGDYAIILSPDLTSDLETIQASLPERRFVVSPIPLSDGTSFLRADVLSEIGFGQLYEQGFSQISPSQLSEATVVPLADAVALVPYLT